MRSGDKDMSAFVRQLVRKRLFPFDSSSQTRNDAACALEDVHERDSGEDPETQASRTRGRRDAGTQGPTYLHP